MKRIAAIAFTCFPMMGFSQTPPEVWACNVTQASISDMEVFDSGEAMVKVEEGGLVYIRPSTNDIFDGNSWNNVCDDRDGALQVVLTEDGCNIVEIKESGVSSMSWSVDLDTEEAHLRGAELNELFNRSIVTKFSNCQVASPALFE